MEALQNPQLCFRDEVLRTATVKLDKLGRPRPISGNFASVFSLTAANGGSRYAVKCFTRYVKDQDTRYRAISSHLDQVSAPWKVGFQYLAKGVLIEGSWYPILKMEWVEGISLIPWIEQHLDSPGLILELAEKFANLVSSLGKERIAHGDLQHGNLLIAADNSVRLVDYDGMFVPALDGLEAAERGHRNYQQPRRLNEFHTDVDRFSSWVIYLSLLALGGEPSLWRTLREDRGEYLLLAEDDYRDPNNSARFLTLFNSPTAEIRELARRVSNLIDVPADAIPNLTPVDLAISSVVPDSPRRNATASRPQWMDSYVPSAPHVDRVQFAGRSVLAPITLLSFVSISLLLIVLVALGPVPIVIGGLLSLATLLSCASILTVSYRRRAEVIARAPVIRRLTEISRFYRREQRALRVINSELEAIDDVEAKRAKSYQVQNEGCHRRNKDEGVRVEKNLQKTLSRLASDRSKLDRQRQVDLDMALERIQSSYLDSKLSTIRLQSAKIAGFGPKMIANLRDAGIVTAADLQDVYVVLNGQTKTAVLKLRSGRRVQVPGIGPVKAERLADWLTGQRQAAQRGMPTRIPDADRRAIYSRYSQREHAIDAAEQQARADVLNRKKELGQRLSSELAILLSQQKKENALSTQKRSECLQRRSVANDKITILGSELRVAEHAASEYSEITFVRFVKFVIVGRRG